MLDFHGLSIVKANQAQGRPIISFLFVSIRRKVYWTTSRYSKRGLLLLAKTVLDAAPCC